MEVKTGRNASATAVSLIPVDEVKGNKLFLLHKGNKITDLGSTNKTKVNSQDLLSHRSSFDNHAQRSL